MELAVAEEGHVHGRGDVPLDQAVPDRVEPGFRAYVLDDERRSALHPLDVAGAPFDRVPELLLPRMCRVADGEAVLLAPLDVADLDVAEEGHQRVGGVGDDLVGRRLVGGEREDPDEQLEPQAVLPPIGHVLHVALGGIGRPSASWMTISSSRIQTTRPSRAIRR